MSAQPRYDASNQHFVGQQGRLIPLLQQAQQADGYVTRAKMLEIHQQTGIPLANIFGVATFYAQFRLSPVGRNVVRVCQGTACHVSGAPNITEAVESILGITRGETTADREFTIEAVSCIGCCSLAPVLVINDDTYGNLDERRVKKVIDSYRTTEESKSEPES